MAIKIPLKMSDGTTVRTIEELREHFNLADVLGYYESGRLTKWLSSGFYDEEAEKVKALDPSSKDFRIELCNILGMDYKKYGKLDKDVAKRNERRERLRQYTADDRILASVDNVAFTQKELKNLLKKADTLEKDDDDNTVIYLCGEHFTIPADIGGIIYKGVNNPNPTVTFDGEIVGAGIDLQDLEFDIVSYIDGNPDSFWKAFEESSILGTKLIRLAAEQGSGTAQFILGECCHYGRLGAQKDRKEAEKWYRKAAEQGDKEAQRKLSKYYSKGSGTSKNKKETKVTKSKNKAAPRKKTEPKQPQGNVFSKIAEIITSADINWDNAAVIHFDDDAVVKELHFDDDIVVDEVYDDAYEEIVIEASQTNVEEDYDDAERLYRKKAEQGNAEAQCMLGFCYYEGEGASQNYEEAVKWYRKAAEQGNAEAQCKLGLCFYGGKGVSQNYEEAVKWLRKAAEQGNAEAQASLAICYLHGNGVEKDMKEYSKWTYKSFGRTL